MDTLLLDRPKRPSLDELAAPFRHETKRVLHHWKFSDYIQECFERPSLLDTAARRMYNAIRPAVEVSTTNDPRLKRLFGERVINDYPDFADFYGLEAVIDQLIEYYRLAADGADIRKKILILVGPPGAAKSALAKRLQTIFGRTSMHVLAVRKEEGNEVTYELSPFFEHPFELLERERWRERCLACGLPPYLLSGSGPSPWAWKHLEAFDGDLERFEVIEIPCSAGRQQGIFRIEPRSEKRVDSTVFTGLCHKGEYEHSGGLNRAGQGLLEVVEMLKMPLDVLRPLQTAMDEGTYAGDGGVGPIPFRGMIIGHCNRPEWDEFCKKAENKHFRERLYPIFVPYCLRMTEEERIYLRLLEDGALYKKPRAPGTTAALARLTIASRLKPAGGTVSMDLLKVYDGEDPKDLGEGMKSLDHYLNEAAQEGWGGISTRDGAQILSGAFTRDPKEVGVDPHLLLEEALSFIKKSREGESDNEKRGVMDRWESFIRKTLLPDYLDLLERDIKLAYAVALGGDTPEEWFAKYTALARVWATRAAQEPEQYRDPTNSALFWGIERVNDELIKLEKGADIAEPASFRDDIAKDVWRATKPLTWDQHPKMRAIIEKQLFANGGDLPSVIASGITNRNAEAEKRHLRFVDAMLDRGYSKRQVERLVTWYMAERKLSPLPQDKHEK